MINLVTDTHQLITHLESFGFSKKQAEGVTEALNKLDISQVATKHDVLDAKHDLKQDMTNLKLEFQDLKSEFKELRSEFKESRADMKRDLMQIKAEIYKSLIPILLGQVSLFFVLTQFFGHH